MIGSVCLFSTEAFLILAIIIAKIVYLDFLANYTNEITPIIWMFKVLSEFLSSTVFYVIFYSDLGSLNILFIVKYQSF